MALEAVGGNMHMDTGYSRLLTVTVFCRPSTVTCMRGGLYRLSQLLTDGKVRSIHRGRGRGPVCRGHRTQFSP